MKLKLVKNNLFLKFQLKMYKYFVDFLKLYHNIIESFCHIITKERITLTLWKRYGYSL